MFGLVHVKKIIKFGVTAVFMLVEFPVRHISRLGRIAFIGSGITNRFRGSSCGQKASSFMKLFLEVSLNFFS